jgi:diguanylate cyclase (GGDEF)-like protein
MPQLMSIIIIGPVILGAAILIFSIFPVRKLILQLPAGVMRRNWFILNGLIIFFIGGYISYALVLGNRDIHLADLVVSMIFFFCSCFVWLVNTLSLQTALDVRRISMLEHENITDSLIDVYNRRYFDRRIDEEFERAYRYGLPLSILMLDIDHFKRVNDTFGHQGGDSALIGLGRLLIDTVRNTDIVARYGGEELCIITTNTQGTSALELAERLRVLVDAADLVAADEKKGLPPIHLTVSIGVSTLHQGIKTAAELIKHADIALYSAKKQGRNRVAAAEVPLVAGNCDLDLKEV